VNLVLFEKEPEQFRLVRSTGNQTECSTGKLFRRSDAGQVVNRVVQELQPELFGNLCRKSRLDDCRIGLKKQGPGSAAILLCTPPLRKPHTRPHPTTAGRPLFVPARSLAPCPAEASACSPCTGGTRETTIINSSEGSSRFSPESSRAGEAFMHTRGAFCRSASWPETTLGEHSLSPTFRRPASRRSGYNEYPVKSARGKGIKNSEPFATVNGNILPFQNLHGMGSESAEKGVALNEIHMAERTREKTAVNAKPSRKINRSLSPHQRCAVCGHPLC